jgi:O-antigen ligase
MKSKRQYFKLGAFVMALGLPFIPFRYLALLQLVCFGFYILEKMRNQERLTIGSVDVMVLTFYIFIILSTIFSETLGLSAVLLLYYTAGITLYYIMAHEFNRNDYVTMALIFLASSMLVSVIGIKQYLSGDLGHVAWLDKKANPNIQARAYSSFNNPNVLGEYLLSVIVMNMMLIAMGKNIWKKIILMIPLGINALTLLLTFSRGAWIGFVLAFIIMVVVYDKRLIPVIAILGILALFVLPQVFVDRILTIFIHSGDSSTDYRYLIWFGGKNILKDYWLFGTGLGYGSFSKVYSLYRMGEVYAAHSHNIFYEILLEMGIFGLISYLMLVIKSFVSGIGEIIDSQNSAVRMIIIAGIAALSGLMLHGLVENTLFDVRIITMIWILFGFTVYRGDAVV